MRIKDLLEYHNIETSIDNELKEHKLDVLSPPADKYTYKYVTDEEAYADVPEHLFTNKTGKVLTEIRIRDELNNVLVIQWNDPDAPGYPTYYEIGDNTGTVYF